VDRSPVPVAIAGPRVIAIGRRLDPTAIPAIGEALVAGGIRAFEITMDSAGATGAITALARRFTPEELLVGAGTVLDVERADAACAAGARFLVMPHLDREVLAWAVEHGVPVFPGALTPTEIVEAWRAGATAVKVFPASAVGPAFIRELRGPLREVPLIPTGGVTVDDAGAFLSAGAVAVGLGSWLTGGGDPSVIRGRAERIIGIAQGSPPPG
jgi:2-dehydro-3-deoxyphosphogluconate aldolase / (4S)-4-hydroxy-2-oxoglutarate aldolase